jgi:hypothetical protein
MKSIKPGRGPSAMGAAGSAFAVIFGIIWTFAASSMGAPPFFVVFGFLFICMGIFQFIYNYKNATGENRMSIFDITDDSEESDPFDKFIKKEKSSKIEKVHNKSYKYCPYCGKDMKEDYKFCPSCGKEL